MANQVDPLFNIDAGKILAKLHLAGQSQIPNSIVINTAIKNPVKTADPKNPGDVEFDLDNKTGEYQMAVIKPISYRVPIKPQKNKKILKLLKELKQTIDSDKDNKKLLDKTKDKDEKKDNKLSKTQKELISLLKGYGLNFTESDNFEETMKSFKEALKAENEKIAKEKEEKIKEIQKKSIEDIKAYFLNFAGKENSSKIKESEIVQRNADADGKKIKEPGDFDSNIKDFKIETNDIDSEIQKKEEEHQKKEPKDAIQYFTRNIMFAVGYSIEIETM